MRILLLGNPYLRTDFEVLGHQVIAVTPDGRSDVRFQKFPVGIHEVMAALPKRWMPDLVIIGDDSTYPLILGSEFLEVPLAWFAVDSHIHARWHRDYAAAFDVILVAQKPHVQSYLFDPNRQVVQWLPLYCDPQHDRRLSGPKRYDLCFVGTVNSHWNPDRARLIEELRRRVNIYVTTGDYVEPFNRSRVVLNQCVANDVNFRTFQALACGSLLLMERVDNGLDDLFQDCVHLVTYDKGDVEQIVERSRYYNARESEREDIAASGRSAVLASHTSLHRAQSILALLAEHDVNRLISLRKAGLPHIQYVLATVYERAANAYAREASCCVPGSQRWRGMRRIEDTYNFFSQRIRVSLTSVPQGVA